jgi:hypothetical protein
MKVYTLIIVNTLFVDRIASPNILFRYCLHASISSLPSNHSKQTRSPLRAYNAVLLQGASHPEAMQVEISSQDSQPGTSGHDDRVDSGYTESEVRAQQLGHERRVSSSTEKSLCLPAVLQISLWLHTAAGC